MFIAATVPVEKEGAVNPLLEAAKTIGDPPDEENANPAVAVLPFDPESPPMIDNGNASFERFMGSFGTPNRWAGR